MVKDYFTVDEVAEILDIYEISAKELLEGRHKFIKSELKELADYKGISVKKLVSKAPTDSIVSETESV